MKGYSMNLTTKMAVAEVLRGLCCKLTQRYNAINYPHVTIKIKDL